MTKKKKSFFSQVYWMKRSQHCRRWHHLKWMSQWINDGSSSYTICCHLGTLTMHIFFSSLPLLFLLKASTIWALDRCGDNGRQCFSSKLRSIHQKQQQQRWRRVATEPSKIVEPIWGWVEEWKSLHSASEQIYNYYYSRHFPFGLFFYKRQAQRHSTIYLTITTPLFLSKLSNFNIFIVAWQTSALAVLFLFSFCIQKWLVRFRWLGGSFRVQSGTNLSD